MKKAEGHCLRFDLKIWITAIKTMITPIVNINTAMFCSIIGTNELKVAIMSLRGFGA